MEQFLIVQEKLHIFKENPRFQATNITTTKNKTKKKKKKKERKKRNERT